jgi:hypothetical protein
MNFVKSDTFLCAFLVCLISCNNLKDKKTGSIGLYYTRENEVVKTILDVAAREYIVDPSGN